MKKYLFMAVAAMLAFSSCSNESEEIANNDVKGQAVTTFTAKMENNGTRAMLNGLTPNWEINDVVNIDGYAYTVSEVNDESTLATLTGEGADWYVHEAYFPAYLYNNGATILPAEITEDWRPGQFNMPMYAQSYDNDLQFYNICGVLAITVKNDQVAAVKSIKVSSANKAVSGVFSVNSEYEAVLESSDDASNTLTVTYQSAVTTTAEGVVFYVAVPAQTYQELKIEIGADGDGYTKSMTTKAATNITVERNKIYPITYADNAVPAATTGVAKATINGSEVDVNWVQLWADGPKFAEYNVGAENNKAEDYGGYYAWGGNQDKVDDHNTGTDALTGDNDTATKLWGNNWRMPTKAELQALLDNCAVEWTTVNGVNGRKYTGKGDYASNSVFLPAAGYYNRGVVRGQGNQGFYWSSSTDDSDCANYQYFNSSNQGVGTDDRYCGYSVRPVLAE